MESPFSEISPTPERRDEKDAPLPRCLRHRAPIYWLLLPFMAGIVFGRISPWAVNPLWALGAAVPVLCVALLFTERKIAWAICLLAGLTLSGAAYYEIRRDRLAAWDNLPPREAKLTLRVERTFAPSPDGKRVSGFGRVAQADAHLTDLVGQRLYFSLARKNGDAVPVRSAEIAVVGVLQTLPKHAAGGSFDGYLTNLGLNFRLNRGRVLAQTKEPSAYRQFCQATQARFAGFLGIGLGKHPDLAGISRAMLLGLQQELSEDQVTLFMRSGTMHLFSISGLHIAVIALALDALLGLFRLPRAARFAASVVLLWLYVDITGTAPSAVRAYLMVVLFQAAFVLRLPVNAVATLGFAALGALIVDPMQLFTASFQMSYGIVAALLLLGLPLGDFWYRRWQLFRLLPKATWRWWHHALDWSQQKFFGVLAVGVASVLVSTVCGVIYFGLFTPGSLVANLVLIPVGSLVILSGFVSLLCGIAGLGTLCSLFNHASALILLACKKGIGFFLKVPGVFWPAEFSSDWLGFAFLAALLALLFWGYAARWENRRGGVWPPFILVALALAFGVKFG